MHATIKPKVVVVGSANTDMIMKVAHLPRPGETVLGGRFSMAAGGKGANQAVAAARAGGQVTFIAKVGEDVFGRQARECCLQDGIDVRFMRTDPGAPSGAAVIVVDEKGENSIAVASGANMELTPEDVEDARSAIAGADALIVQLEVPLQTVQTAVDIAQSAGFLVVLNPAPAQPLPDTLLRRVSIITPNESEAELLTGMRISDDESVAAAARALAARGVATVVITLGGRGAFVSHIRFTGFVPPFQVPAIDTTAAGDVFNGALTVALAEKRPMDEAVRFANAAAALSVMMLGAQPSIPRRDAIERLLARGRPDN